MSMLIDSGAQAMAFRPPPAEDLTEEERRRLRATLAGVVESWRGGIEVGLRVAELRQPSETLTLDEQPGDVHFRAGAAPVALSLSREAAVSLLCVNLGSAMPETPGSRLSDLDLALLDAWAARALPELVTAVGGGPAGQVLRRRGTEPGNALLAELTFAGGMRAGTVTIGVELARPRSAAAPDTLGDHPELLLGAGMSVEAAIVTDAVPLTELVTLEHGDVLLLGQKDAVAAELTAGEAVVAEGRPGARAGMRALRIKGGVLTDGDDRLGENSDGF